MSTIQTDLLNAMYLQLNLDPFDIATRLELADLYEDMGDLISAYGQRWLAKKKLSPEPDDRQEFGEFYYRWYHDSDDLPSSFKVLTSSMLPKVVWNGLIGYIQDYEPIYWKTYTTRRKAEEALSAALASFLEGLSD